MWLFTLKYFNVEGNGNFGSWVSLAAFQGLKSHKWLVATVLTARTSFPPCRTGSL